jgi:hypothetical protein
VDNNSPAARDNLQNLGRLIQNCASAAPAALQPYVDALGQALEYGPDAGPAARHCWRLVRAIFRR